MNEYSTPIAFSIVSSWFNVEAMKFPWREALANWLSFLGSRGQLVIAVNKSTDNTPQLVRDWLARWHTENPHSAVKTLVIDIDISYTNPAFDGMGKAAATAAATGSHVILLDCDERILPSQRRRWQALAAGLDMTPFDGYMIPVIDLIGDEQHYKAGDNLGSKWYLHKNRSYLTRGVVKHAWNEDGKTWNTSISDSCELINKETGELARAVPIMAPLPHWLAIGQLEGGEVPFVYHLGYLDQEQRLRQSAFWRPIWDSRAGNSGQEPEQTLAKLAEIPRYGHRLPSWRMNYQ